MLACCYALLSACWSRPDTIGASSSSNTLTLRYLEQLRILATNINNFDTPLVNAMKNTPFLLASQLVLKDKRSGEHEEDFRREWVLAQASETVLADNATLHSFFGHYVLTVPEETILESFYQTLGAKRLSSCVVTETVPSGVRQGSSSDAQTSRKFILERLTIFLGHTTRRGTDYTVDFLSKGDNFTVSEASSIRVRYTYKDGKNVHQHVEVG